MGQRTDASRVRSNVFFIFFEGGAAGLVDGIAALNGASRQKSNCLPAQWILVEVETIHYLKIVDLEQPSNLMFPFQFQF